MIHHEEVRNIVDYYVGSLAHDKVLRAYINEQEKKDELLELYIHSFNIFTKRNEITIKLEDKITLNEIFRKINALEEELK